MPTTATENGGVFYSLVNAAFSIAVVISIMGLIAVAYIIIRTRQLHHHEHDVRHAAGGGADAHGHAPATSTAHSATASVTHVESVYETVPTAPHVDMRTDDDDSYEFATPDSGGSVVDTEADEDEVVPSEDGK